MIPMRIPEDVREYFRKQGRIGGTKRRDSLSPEQRREIARKAARARWATQVRESKKGKGTK